MILNAVELTHVGPFRDTVRIGPLSRGVNILSAGNEWGKSTTLRATARALFDRHTTRSEEIRALQPAGTDLAPSVAVEFECAAGRFRIEKTFLTAPRSLLRRWEANAWVPVAEADAADRRLQDLLQSSLPGRGATQPEHWGLLGFLWARQGEPAQWPALDTDSVGQRIRARLAQVEIDPVIEDLRQRLGAKADALLTPGGLPKAGGALRQAEDDVAAIDRELASLRQTRADLETAHLLFNQAEGAVVQLELELAECERNARQLGEQALAVERLRGELETRLVELKNARDALAAVAGDVDKLAAHTGQLTALRAAQQEAAALMRAGDERQSSLHKEIERHEQARADQEGALADLRQARQRTQDLLKLRDTRQQHLEQQRLATSATLAQEAVRRAEARLAKLPPLTAARLRALEDKAETVRNLEAQSLALGLTAELTPDQDRRVRVQDAGDPLPEPLPAGTTTRVQRPQILDLELEGWGRLVVRSGARESQSLASDLSKHRTALKSALQESEVSSVDEARTTLTLRQEIDLEVRAARAALDKDLGSHGSFAVLQETLARTERRVEAMLASLQPTDEETALSRTALESAEVQSSEALPALEQRLKVTHDTLTRLRQEERAVSDALKQATRAHHDHTARLRTLETQVTDLQARYPDGLTEAKRRAQIQFAEAEARHVATLAKLPADHERLPERNRRAAAALQQVQNALLARRSERDSARGKLETVGGLGLYSRETALEERRSEACLRRDACHAQAWTSRLAHDLIEHRKQAATRAVLAPLEARLSDAFADLTGVSSRRVFLTDKLEIQGIGTTRDAAHAFEWLSQGAKEQLLLCLRLAVARELAATEPQVLILDDVLVNTDKIRQARVLDLLAHHAAHLQILLLTCHDDRYRGLGETVRLGAGK